MWGDNTTGTFDLIVGPQSDGTNTVADASVIPTPVDAGGGAPGMYSSQVLDVFKFGVGTWSKNQQYKDLLDYKRYEATNAGLWRQGQPALFAHNSQGGNGNLVILAALVIGAVILLQEKA